jgi:hypothetical protein
MRCVAANSRWRAARTCRKLLSHQPGRRFCQRFARSRTDFGPAVALGLVAFAGLAGPNGIVASAERTMDEVTNLGAVGFVMESRANPADIRETSMARIHCTIVETSAMATGLGLGCDPEVTPTPGADSPEPRGRFESQAGPVYCDLLPWADPYIASLVRDLQMATGAMLPHGWPRCTAPDLGSARRNRDQRWSERYRSDE